MPPLAEGEILISISPIESSAPVEAAIEEPTVVMPSEVPPAPDAPMPAAEPSSA